MNKTAIIASGALHGSLLLAMIPSDNSLSTAPSLSRFSTLDIQWEQPSPVIPRHTKAKQQRVTKSEEFIDPTTHAQDGRRETLGDKEEMGSDKTEMQDDTREKSNDTHSDLIPDAAAASSTLNRKPHYPEEARLMGIEGTVMLQLDISPSGEIQKISVLEPKAHPILEQATLKQIKSWTFPPALTSHSITVPIQFKLD